MSCTDDYNKNSIFPQTFQPIAPGFETSIPTWRPLRLFDQIDMNKTYYNGSSFVDGEKLYNNNSLYNFISVKKQANSLDEIRRARQEIVFKGRNNIVENNYKQLLLTQPNKHQIFQTGGNNYRRI
jgi:hypothetical protein